MRSNIKNDSLIKYIPKINENVLKVVFPLKIIYFNRLPNGCKIIINSNADNICFPISLSKLKGTDRLLTKVTFFLK